MVEKRVNPDKILKKINEEAERQQRGQLKIFFGYAAGVGKTYAMLEAAHIAKKRGVDVIVGYIEPHTRPETMDLLKGLEVLPTKSISHKGINLNEFDIDSAIERNPKLILIDELAHTNASGCRHLKRYQDINELLKLGINVYTTVNVQHIESLNDIVASITGIMVRERIPDLKRYQDINELLKLGINVYTTVNVQHIESLNDIVASITGIMVRERIPDHVFDNASQVELVDIEPEELIERLNNGKIYKAKQAQRAIENFFSLENLTALREIALRQTADHVNRISEKVKNIQGNEYFTDENILVCLSSSPSNPKIIRTGSRMAKAFKGEFTALFVETSDFENMDKEDKKRLRSNTRLAQQLGANIETVYGDDIAFQIAEFARLSGVSKIILGRSSIKRKFLFGKMSLTERLTSYVPNLDIYIIPDKSSLKYYSKKVKKTKPQFTLVDFFGKMSLTERLTSYVPNLDIYIIPDKSSLKYYSKKVKKTKPQFTLVDFFKSLLILIISTILSFIFYSLGFSEANIITVYILGVLVTAVITESRLQSVISSLISVFVFNLFFINPRFTFSSYDEGYYVTFIIMFTSAILTGSLASKIKEQVTQSTQIAYRTKVLLETNRLIQQANDRDGIIKVIAIQLRKLLNKDIIFYSANDGKL